jgi:hypothetical protein
MPQLIIKLSEIVDVESVILEESDFNEFTEIKILSAFLTELHTAVKFDEDKMVDVKIQKVDDEMSIVIECEDEEYLSEIKGEIPESISEEALKEII